MHRPARAVLITVAAAIAAIMGGAGGPAHAADLVPATAPAPATTPTAAGRAVAPGVVNGIVNDHPGGGEPSSKRAVAGAAAARGEVSVYGTVAKTLSVTVQRQSTSYYCAPASGRVAISALVSPDALPSQRALAALMGTTTSGTALSQIGPALNATQKKNAYVYVSGMDLAGYRSRVRGGIDSYGAPQVAPVQMSRLPWYAGTGISGGHAVAGYGYLITTKSWLMHVYDPWDGVRHTSVNSMTVFTASLNRDLIW